jgi:hypothetical protein
VPAIAEYEEGVRSASIISEVGSLRDSQQVERGRRLGENEALFRRLNERIEELAEGAFDNSEKGAPAWDFVCECYDKSCTERVALTIAEYEAVRTAGERSIVAPAPEHVDTSIENMIDMSSRYWVVEKTDEAAEAARADDPRT